MHAEMYRTEPGPLMTWRFRLRDAPIGASMKVWKTRSSSPSSILRTGPGCHTGAHKVVGIGDQFGFGIGSVGVFDGSNEVRLPLRGGVVGVDVSPDGALAVGRSRRCDRDARCPVSVPVCSKREPS